MTSADTDTTGDMRRAAAKLRATMDNTPPDFITETARTCQLRLADLLDAYAQEIDQQWGTGAGEIAAHALALAYLDMPTTRYRDVDPHELCPSGCACQGTSAPCRCGCPISTNPRRPSAAPTPRRPNMTNIEPTPQRYRKKPVVIEAMLLTPENGPAVWEWADSKPLYDPAGKVCGLRIYTLEGNMTADFGDWIIRGVKGEFYPCKPDVFAATYEPAFAAGSEDQP